MDTELEKLLQDQRIQLLKNYPQHIHTTTFEHSKHVANRCLKLADRWRLKVDRKALVRAAMLHDYYLYNIKDEKLTAWQHGTRHPQIAIENAGKVFDLSEKEKSIMRSHMWPLTLTKPPKCKEAWLLCLADKICAVEEELFWKDKRSFLR